MRERSQSGAKLRQAVELQRQGQLAKAERLCRDVLQRDPANADARNLLGVLALRNGKPDQAVFQFTAALRDNPASPAILTNYARALRLLNRPDEALACLDKALALRPDDAAAWSSRGGLLADLGRPEEALASHDRALASRPDDARILSNRGLVLLELGRLDEALACYDRALAVAPDEINILSNRGRALTALNRLDEALATYARALVLKPDDATSLFGQGLVLARLDRPQEALACFDGALRIDPDNPEILSDRGLALIALGRDADALASFDRALALKPDHVASLCNRGTALANLGRHAAERDSYRRALALRPDDAGLRWNEAVWKLLHGDFAAGWEEYEWRWRTTVFEKHLRGFSEPPWTGETDLEGRTILLHAEQGFGDTLQFCRYASLVQARGARIILEVPPPLMSLLARAWPAARVIARSDAVPAFDTHCPLLSLPRAFGTRLETIPADVPYLRARADSVAAWRARTDAGAARRVGIAWSGSLAHRNDHNRSIALNTFARLLVPDIAFICLQKEVRPSDARTLAGHPEIQCFGDDLRDFDETAGLVAHLDLIISVDTSVAHLAGALGRPVWLLLPFRPDFRWLLGRDDSPWYPTMKLYRQPAPGDWDRVIERVRADLLAFSV